MSSIIKQLSAIGVVPLIVLDKPEDAVPLAKALVRGGIPVGEVTFRTDAAIDAIKAIHREVPEMIVGAGTVHSVEQAQLAIEAGAQFIVTPGFQNEVVQYCKTSQIDILPGCVSPTDLEQALSYGLSAVKFFPAEAYGGVKTLQSLCGPYANIKFMPTGGITLDNMSEYLSQTNVFAIGGSFMIPNALLKAQKWDEITALCQKIIYQIFDFSLAHIGINTTDETEAAQTTNKLSTLFGIGITETPTAYFAGTMFEIIKGGYLGEKGHIAIHTADIKRAISYFENIGVQFRTNTFSYDQNGQPVLVYFEEEINGFAFHLRQK